MTVNNTAFTGKAAFVTGAGSGIGRVTAVAFARAGARVALADRSPDGLRETARLIGEAGRDGFVLPRTARRCPVGVPLSMNSRARAAIRGGAVPARRRRWPPITRAAP